MFSWRWLSSMDGCTDVTSLSATHATPKTAQSGARTVLALTVAADMLGIRAQCLAIEFRVVPDVGPGWIAPGTVVDARGHAAGGVVTTPEAEAVLDFVAA